jgi:hypothetical protein
MSDADLAQWTMSEETDFDINAAQSIAAGAFNASASSASPPPAVQRNKRGHIILERSAPNAWLASTAAAKSVTPTLSSQWSVAALCKEFKEVEQDLIEQVFVRNTNQKKQLDAFCCSRS